MSTTLSVPAQTDYSDISSNQCSWCAMEFALKAPIFRKLFRESKEDKTDILELYTSCLVRGSKLRRDHGTFLYGENIDSANLLAYYRYDVLQKRTVCKNLDQDLLKILHPDLRSEFYTRVYDQVSLNEILNTVVPTISLLVSRHGQSLCIIPHGTKFIVLDSHLHELRVMTKEDTLKHIAMDHGGHLHLTLLYGT